MTVTLGAEVAFGVGAKLGTKVAFEVGENEGKVLFAVFAVGVDVAIVGVREGTLEGTTETKGAADGLAITSSR